MSREKSIPDSTMRRRSGRGAARAGEEAAACRDPPRPADCFPRESIGGARTYAPESTLHTSPVPPPPQQQQLLPSRSWPRWSRRPRLACSCGASAAARAESAPSSAPAQTPCSATPPARRGAPAIASPSGGCPQGGALPGPALGTPLYEARPPTCRYRQCLPEATFNSSALPFWAQCGGRGGACASQQGCADAAFPAAQCATGSTCVRLSEW